MKKGRIPTRVMARLGMLIAISVVLKVFLSFTLIDYRFTFYDIPLMVIGIMFGPLLGGLSGFIVDWLNIMYPNLATGFNLFTVSSILWGVIPGLLLFGRKDLSKLRIVIAVVITSILTFSLNSLQLYIWMHEGMYAGVLPRLVTMLVKIPIQVFIIDVLYTRVLVFDLKLLKSR